MAHIILSVKTKKNQILEVKFISGEWKEYDIKPLFEAYPVMEKLKDESLFACAKVDVGGYGISWNDELDLDGETIWEDGITIKTEEREVNYDIAYQITTLRNHLDMTQSKLSEKTGIYQAEISKVERGIGNPSLNTLQRIADGLGAKLKITFVKEEEKDMYN